MNNLFLITRNIAWIPMTIIIWLGTPFKWKDGSNLRHKSDSEIKNQFHQEKFEHYGKRILTIAIGVFLLCVWFTAVQATKGAIWWIFPVVFSIILFIDIVLAVSRYVYFQDQEKKATGTGKVLVLMEVWKDSSLEALIKRAHTDREAAEGVKTTGKMNMSF